MRKKFIALLLATLFIFGLCACSRSGETSSIEVGQPNIVSGEDVSKEETEKPEELTPEEQFAVNYLLAFSSQLKNPHSLELYRVWVEIYSISSSTNYFITCEYSAKNNVGGRIEGVVGNKVDFIVDKTNRDTLESVLDSLKGPYFADLYFTPLGTNAKKNGKEIDADKILKAYFESL